MDEITQIATGIKLGRESQHDDLLVEALWIALAHLCEQIIDEDQEIGTLERSDALSYLNGIAQVIRHALTCPLEEQNNG